MTRAQELTPGEMSVRSGVAVSALHFYEREGLISCRRTSGNQRRYARETLRRVAFIRMSQRLGIPLARIREEFDAAALSETEIAAEIRETWNGSGYLLDPHSAIGVGAARQRLARDPATPEIVLGTAHPAKFPAAVEAACGVIPKLPAHLADLMERRERFTVLPNDLAAIESFVRERARAVRGAIER